MENDKTSITTNLLAVELKKTLQKNIPTVSVGATSIVITQNNISYNIPISPVVSTKKLGSFR